MKLSDNEKIVNFAGNIYNQGTINHRKFVFSSRDICKGRILVLKRGNKKSIQNYIREARSKGIMGIVTENNISKDDMNYDLPILKISNLSVKLNSFLDYIYSYPTKDMIKIGVTGTNGKTSTCHFLAQFLSNIFPRRNIGVITSDGNGVYPNLSPTSRTTPENHLLYREYEKMRRKNVRILIIECSSQGLHQGRLNSHSFDISILTNIVRDHIEYHKNHANYVDSKLRLLKMTTKYIFIDESLKNLKIENGSAKKIFFKYSPTRKSINEPLIPRDLLIKFGKTFDQYKISKQDHYLSQLKHIPGRYQLVRGNKDEIFLIDYAHTSSSFLDICKYAKSLLTSYFSNMKLLIIFGCGGDRDKEKRITMASHAKKYADFIIVTDDNPRSEDPKKITSQIKDVLNMKNNFEIINNRKAAIRRSLDFARDKYLILLLGKGNESKIIYKDREIYHNDIEFVESLIK